MERNGSKEEEVVRLLHEDVEREMGGILRVNVEQDGTSSRVGGVIPSSVYSQSICTIVAESCVSRFAISPLQRTSSFSSLENRSGVTSRGLSRFSSSSSEAEIGLRMS